MCLLSSSLCSCSLSGFTDSSQLDHLWELFSSLFFSCQPAYLATFCSLPCKLPFLLFIDSASCVGSSALVTGSNKKGLLERNLVLGLVMWYWGMYHRVVSQLSEPVCSYSQRKDLLTEVSVLPCPAAAHFQRNTQRLILIINCLIY